MGSASDWLARRLKTCLPALAACLAGWLLIAAPPRSFEHDVKPVLTQVCSKCHNPELNSGNMNVSNFLDASSLTSDRAGWTTILARLKAGEMPPSGTPRPSAETIAAMIGFVQEALDKGQKPDAGRVIAHRLNRSEYANTVHDLLGVDFRADEEFPADDSGYGFDNIGDVLTVSPALMREYLAAAEKIARAAVGGDPLPPPGFVNRRDLVRRPGPDVIETKYNVDYDAEYVVKVNLNGYRSGESKPVTLRISVDGRPVKTVDVDTRMSEVNRQGGNTQRHTEEERVFLTANEHTFRAEFLNDDFVKDLGERALTNPHSNIFPESFEIGGPYAPATPHPVSKKVMLCDPATGPECIDRILTTFAHHAYRQPATKVEVADLTAIYDKAKNSGYTPKQSLQFAIADALVSPQFLFRVERDPAPGATGRISDTELASRISYFLWSSAPDDELLKLAESGQLHRTDVLDGQVKRMIADPRSSALAENFAAQWLQTRSLDAVKPDAAKFPQWNATLKDEMRTETRMFFEAVMRENKLIADFIDGRYTFLNEHLANYYGIAGVTGSDFRRLELTDANAARRSGVFTQAGVLTVTSYPTRTSVVLRGKYLLETVLNDPPPPPPPDVPPLDEQSAGVARSLRQQMEAHRSDPVCAACHLKMDPLGFGLENYDAIGRWRMTDGKFPIDASGVFPDGKSFSGPAEMKALLRDRMPEFIRGLAEKMLTYALCRGVEAYDRPVVDELVRETAAGDNRFQPLIIAVVHSLPFQYRHAPAPTVALRDNKPKVNKPQ
jgi:hypothetical protein